MTASLDSMLEERGAGIAEALGGEGHANRGLVRCSHHTLSQFWELFGWVSG